MNLTQKQIDTIKTLAEFNDHPTINYRLMAFIDFSDERYRTEIYGYLTDLNKLAEIYQKLEANIDYSKETEYFKLQSELIFSWSITPLGKEHVEKFAHQIAQTIREMEEK